MSENTVAHVGADLNRADRLTVPVSVPVALVRPAHRRAISASSNKGTEAVPTTSKFRGSVPAWAQSLRNPRKRRPSDSVPQWPRIAKPVRPLPVAATPAGHAGARVPVAPRHLGPGCVQRLEKAPGRSTRSFVPGEVRSRRARAILSFSYWFCASDQGLLLGLVVHPGAQFVQQRPLSLPGGSPPPDRAKPWKCLPAPGLIATRDRVAMHSRYALPTVSTTISFASSIESLAPPKLCFAAR